MAARQAHLRRHGCSEVVELLAGAELGNRSATSKSVRRALETGSALTTFALAAPARFTTPCRPLHLCYEAVCAHPPQQSAQQRVSHPLQLQQHPPPPSQQAHQRHTTSSHSFAHHCTFLHHYKLPAKPSDSPIACNRPSFLSPPTTLVSSCA